MGRYMLCPDYLAICLVVYLHITFFSQPVDGCNIRSADTFKHTGEIH